MATLKRRCVPDVLAPVFRGEPQGCPLTPEAEHGGYVQAIGVGLGGLDRRDGEARIDWAPSGAQWTPSSVVSKTCDSFEHLPRIRLDHRGSRDRDRAAPIPCRTARSVIAWPASGPPMQFQLHPTSGDTFSPPETPARSELLRVRPMGGSASVLVVTPRASSQTYCQVLPLSCEGRMP